MINSRREAFGDIWDYMIEVVTAALGPTYANRLHTAAFLHKDEKSLNAQRTVEAKLRLSADGTHGSAVRALKISTRELLAAYAGFVEAHPSELRGRLISTGSFGLIPSSWGYALTLPPIPQVVVGLLATFAASVPFGYGVLDVKKTREGARHEIEQATVTLEAAEERYHEAFFALVAVEILEPSESQVVIDAAFWETGRFFRSSGPGHGLE